MQSGSNGVLDQCTILLEKKTFSCDLVYMCVCVSVHHVSTKSTSVSPTGFFFFFLRCTGGVNVVVRSRTSSTGANILVNTHTLALRDTLHISWCTQAASCDPRENIPPLMTITSGGVTSFFWFSHLFSACEDTLLHRRFYSATFRQLDLSAFQSDASKSRMTDAAP